VSDTPLSSRPAPGSPVPDLRPVTAALTRALATLIARIDARATGLDPASLLWHGVSQADIDIITEHVAAQAPGG
jgi:hypothetical protein